MNNFAAHILFPAMCIVMLIIFLYYVYCAIDQMWAFWQVHFVYLEIDPWQKYVTNMSMYTYGRQPIPFHRQLTNWLSCTLFSPISFTLSL